MSQLPPAGWHPDPFRLFQVRYWDGGRWTEHVASDGQQRIDPPVGTPSPAAVRPAPAASLPAPTPAQSRSATKGPANRKASKKIQKQVQKLGLADITGFPDQGIFSEPVLVINQKGKLVELRAEFALFDRHGRQLAAVRGKRMSSRMTVIDMLGRTLLDLRRELNLLGARYIVTHGDGRKIGRVLHSKNWNQIDRAFKIEDSENEMIGGVYREDRGRHRYFNVQDAGGHIVASISKTHAGLAKELFTKGDNYVLEFPGSVEDPLRSLSITAALIIDTAYHQH
jgi:uncharacterized protein YxjI